MEVKGVAKNPLAIIALFISFMYGSASLILGTSIEKLDELSRQALVAFLILFPMVIFGSFLFLVIKHHRKLYAPGDYRSDESFLAGIPTVSEDKKQREEQEAEDEPAEPDTKKITKLAPEQIEAPATISAAVPTSRPQARLAEALAADLFQKRFGGVLKRNVQFSSRDGRKFIFDFAIESGSTIYIGEVKLARSTSLKTALHIILGKFFAFDNAEIPMDFRVVKIAVIVIDDTSPETKTPASLSRRIREVRQEGASSNFLVEIYTMSQLLGAASGDVEG